MAVVYKNLTGRVRPRRTWYGAVVMQVEVNGAHRGSPFLEDKNPFKVWRDADINDPLDVIYISKSHVEQEPINSKPVKPTLPPLKEPIGYGFD